MECSISSPRRDIFESSNSEESRYIFSIEKRDSKTTEALSRQQQLERDAERLYQQRERQHQSRREIHATEKKMQNGGIVKIFVHYHEKQPGPATYQDVFKRNARKIPPRLNRDVKTYHYVNQQQLSNPGPYTTSETTNMRVYPEIGRNSTVSRQQSDQKCDYYRGQPFVNLQRTQSHLGKNHRISNSERTLSTCQPLVHNGDLYYINEYRTGAKDIIFPEASRFGGQEELDWLTK